MNTLVVLVILLIALAGGYYYWQNYVGWQLVKSPTDSTAILLSHNDPNSFKYDVGAKSKIVIRNVKYVAADGSGDWSKEMDKVLQDYIAANQKKGVIDNGQLGTLIGATAGSKMPAGNYTGTVLFSFEYKYV